MVLSAAQRKAALVLTTLLLAGLLIASAGGRSFELGARLPRGLSTVIPVRAVDLNVASAAQLEALPGIGPALAGRILSDRARHGRYPSLGALERVPGIGPATVARLRPYLTVCSGEACGP